MFSRTASPTTATPSWELKIRRAVSLIVAFATLSEESAPHDPADEPSEHPHRKPLRPPVRVRRPGATPARSQSCLTPLVRSTSHRHTSQTH